MNTRRHFLGGAAAAAATGATMAQSTGLLTPLPADSAFPPEVLVFRHDKRVAEILERQITDPANPNAGGYADVTEIVSPQSGSGVVAVLAAAWLCPNSGYYRDAELVSRIRLATAFLERKQLPSGNLDLLTTNFNSPPDTAFVAHNVAPAAILGTRAGETEFARGLMPFLEKSGSALSVGGVHTPNHRWVLCSALALINHLAPKPEYTRRIDQWLAEQIDIDEDGLYTERSPLVYSPVVNRSLICMAEFLKRPALLDPVRRNLESALCLMHPNGELVTELSGRQDQNTIGSMGVNWMGLQYMAEHDGNPVFAWLARKYEGDYADLPFWMLLPLLQRKKAATKAPPDSCRKVFRNASLHRVRNGKTSVSIYAQQSDRVFTIRHGDAVVEAVRFASAFFGKGQFVAESSAAEELSVAMSQSLSGPYYQPLDPPERIPSDPAAWSRSRLKRAQSEVAPYTQKCTIHEHADHFAVEVVAEGTPNVPVSIEINVRDGVAIGGVRTVPQSPDSFLSTGEAIVLSAGGDSLRIEAPTSAHAYTQLRGARPKLPGRSVYVTGFSPFKATLRFRF